MKLLISQIFIILAVSLFFRLIFLDVIPSGISNDELEYVVNARSFSLNGLDITGKYSLTNFTTTSDPKAEFPFLVSLPFVGLFGTSLFTARLGYTLLGCIFVFVLYLIAKELFDSKVAFITGLLAAVNPWSIYYSRTAYDVPVAILMFLIAFYLLLKLKNWHILLMFIPLIIAFYSYIGTKLLFLPFVLTLIIYGFYMVNKKKYRVPYLTLFLMSLILFIFFSLNITKTTAGTRLSQIALPTDEKISAQVNYERKLVLENPYKSIFSNKISIYMRERVERYFLAFSPDILFLRGEGNATFSLWYHGLFYYTDVIFLIIGLFFLFIKNRPFLLFIFVLSSISIIPSMVNNGLPSYVHRASLMYPFLLLVTGLGLSRILEITKSLILKSLIVFVIFLEILNFSYIYFFRFPVYNSEAFAFSQNILSKYLVISVDKKEKVIVVTSSPFALYKMFLFYADVLNNENIKKLQNQVAKEIYVYNNLVFTSTCPDNKILSNVTYIVEANHSCLKAFIKEKHVSVPVISDNAVSFAVYHDRICSPYGLSSYVSNLEMSDLKISDLNPKDFCQKFIVK